jgi:hypothetical protein
MVLRESSLVSLSAEKASAQKRPPPVRDQANEWYNRIKKAIVLGQGETVIDEFVEDSEAIREEDEMYVERSPYARNDVIDIRF